MPLTPQITLTATLEDLTGQPAGTTASPARLLIELCNYGLTLPRIPDTSNLTKIHNEVLSTGSEISVLLWGNDVIVPGPNTTYYAITVFDGDGNVVQTGNYRFAGPAVTIDLSDAPQIYPVPLPPPGERVVEVASAGGVAVFDASKGSQITTTFHITLTEDTLASWMSLTKGVPYIVIIEQDATGDWAFDWSGDVTDGMIINTEALGVSRQAFVGIEDGSMAAFSPGITHP